MNDRVNLLDVQVKPSEHFLLAADEFSVLGRVMVASLNRTLTDLNDVEATIIVAKQDLPPLDGKGLASHHEAVGRLNLLNEQYGLSPLTTHMSSYEGACLRSIRTAHAQAVATKLPVSTSLMIPPLGIVVGSDLGDRVKFTSGGTILADYQDVTHDEHGRILDDKGYVRESYYPGGTRPVGVKQLTAGGCSVDMKSRITYIEEGNNFSVRPMALIFGM